MQAPRRQDLIATSMHCSVEPLDAHAHTHTHTEVQKRGEPHLLKLVDFAYQGYRIIARYPTLNSLAICCAIWAHSLTESPRV
eukprot:702334-Amphidinium_carterae.1